MLREGPLAYIAPIVLVFSIIVGALTVFTNIGSPRESGEIIMGYVYFAVGTAGILAIGGYICYRTMVLRKARSQQSKSNTAE